MTRESLLGLSDRELLEVTATAAADERRSTIDLLELLSEVDARRLYLGEGYSSLFTYCTDVLHLSEQAAYHRIEAARAIRVFPVLADRLRDGAMTLTTVALLRPHLTLKNHIQLINEAQNKTKREVERQIACVAPKPAVAALVRRLPEPSMSEPVQRLSPVETLNAVDEGCGGGLESRPEPVRQVLSTSIGPTPKVEALARNRYLLRVSVSSAGYTNLRRAQDLMQHSLPTGDLGAIVERALALLVDHLERQKAAITARPRELGRSRRRALGSRYLPAAVRRAVWERDSGRCAFVGPRGRCAETGRLEFHHLVPFAHGGLASVDNIALRCRAHNAHEGELQFGARDAHVR